MESCTPDYHVPATAIYYKSSAQLFTFCECGADPSLMLVDPFVLRSIMLRDDSIPTTVVG